MRRIVFKLMLFVLTLAVSGLFNASAYAVTGADFQAGRIMDDGVFFNANTIDVAGIQNFLNSKVPVCDTNGTQPYNGTTRAEYSTSRGYPPPFICLKNYTQDTPSRASEIGLCNSYSGGVKTASQIIYDVAQSCGINPKVLIVLLEKEQSLVTDSWPWSIQYRSATGYGCPDTAACDSQYYGFFNQLYNAARQFKRYGRDADQYGYRAGRNNYIQYNPNASCGGSNVFIQNQATAGLYNYTPYQPNASALNNLYGSGDSCGAYGNRNFWRIYNDWFGYVYSSTSVSGAPSAISWKKGRLDIFAWGTDGALWQKWYDSSAGGWQPWARLGGVLSSSPSAISWGEGRIDVFASTSTGELQHKWYGDGSWHNWDNLGRPSSSVGITYSPGAVTWGEGRIDVFARGSDGVLWQKWYDSSAGGWQPWARLDGVLNSSPTVISWEPGRLDLFSTGPASDLQHYWFDQEWKNWESLGVPGSGVTLSTAPGANTWSKGRIDVFARGSDGVLWQKWFAGDAGGWQRWNRFTGVINSAPSITSWEPGRLDLFSTGPASDLQHYWFDQRWGNWDSHGRPYN